jgi:IS5 family transposase
VVGKLAKSVRMAIGSLIIKKHYGFSDEDVVEEIRENPCLQYFLGFGEYSNARPFDSSTMTWFRKRITPEMLTEGRPNRGTLILDATCMPQNIRFPTDVSLVLKPHYAYFIGDD